MICTLAVGPHVDLLEIVRPSLERYALRHGYDLVVRTGTSGLNGRPPSWGKVALVRGLLDRYDVVVWIDVDAVIVDPSRDIAPTGPRRPMHLVTHVIGGVPIPNAGVFVMHRSPTAVRLLERIWHDERWIHHRWWENAALIAAVGGDGDVGLTTRRSRWRARRLLGPLHPRWNSIPTCPDPDPAIMHLAGVPHAERIERLQALVDTGWNRPLVSPH